MGRAKRVRDSQGVTRVAMVVGTVLVSTAVLLAGRLTVDVVSRIGISESRVMATEYAMAETQRIRLLPYDSIQASPRSPIPGAPEFYREVGVCDVGGEMDDVAGYRVVTVTVEPPGDSRPVRVATTVSAR